MFHRVILTPLLLAVLSLTLPAAAEFLRSDTPPTEPKGRKALPVSAAPKQEDCVEDLRHEVWGQLSYGEGYVYGPTNRRSGMTVVDIDRDGDDDFIFPGTGSGPQVMINLGSSSAFYPGGSKDLKLTPLPTGMRFDLGIEFGDLNGDGLEDLLAIVTEESPQFIKRIVWFSNDGTAAGASLPSFTYRGIVTSSLQPGRFGGYWLSLADIDADGDLDLYTAEDFVCDAPPYHRVFFLKNTGTRTIPAWQDPVEIRVLSSQMPDRLGTSKLLLAGIDAASPLRQRTSNEEKGCDFSYNLGDIHIADWDEDGRLDFLFYNASEGLYWIPNVGTAQAPAWFSSLGSGGEPRYDHREIDGLTYAEATLSVRRNPEAAKPGAEWLRDIFLSVNSRLKTYRFFLQEAAYRIIQQTPVAFPAGQGPAGFWDYDGDGDLDLFRMGISGSRDTALLGFENVGTPYNPAWGSFTAFDSVPLREGIAANNWRNDLYQFADFDNSGLASFFVQGQDGRIALYGLQRGTPPVFTLSNSDYGKAVNPIHLNPQGRGIAIADFDQFEDGQSEILTAYTYTGGANIVLIDPFLQEVFDVPDLLPGPNGGTLDPDLIESLSTADTDLDGRPDLIVTVSNAVDFSTCQQIVYINEERDTWPWFDFVPECELSVPAATDNHYDRMPSFADIDADGDDDLFLAHAYPPTDVRNLRQYLRFYRNTGDTGLFYVRYRLITGQTRALTLDLTTGGGSQTQTVTPSYDVVLNSSGGSLLSGSRWQAGAKAPTVDVLDTTDLQSRFDFPGEVRAFVDVLPSTGVNESKAIIVVGDVQTGELYPAFSALGRIAYNVLVSEGLSKNSIRFYADSPQDGDGDGTPDVTAKPTLAGLRDSVTQWARGSNKLLVYLVDHGQRERFRINGSEFIESTDYAQMLGSLQSASPNTHVTTLIDTCESGSFIDNLKGSKRITMTSAGVGPIEGVALFDEFEYISFSLQFWTQIYNGRTYGQAFAEAKASMEAINPLQQPQIDDDGDGIANEGNDGLVANDLRPGASYAVRGPSVFIGSVAPNQTITTNSATLWLSEIVTPFPVEGAKAIIVPPNFERPTADNNDEQPVSALPSVLFTYNDVLDRWEAPFNEFTQGGLYQVQYFVKTGGEYYASPRIGFVDRLNRPDAWESDNTPQTSAWTPVNTVQGHNFHNANDEDWIRFAAPNGPATIAVLSPRPRCQAIVEIYSLDAALAGSATPLFSEAAAAPGEEVVFTPTFAEAGNYVMRIRNTDGNISGRDTSYLSLVAVGTGGILSTSLFVTVVDDETDVAVPGARVFFANSSAGATGNEGVTQVLVPDYGTYTVRVEKEGYATATQNVTVNNSIEEAVVRIGAGTTEGKDPNAGCSCGPEGSRGSRTGDALVIALVFAALTFSRGRETTTR
ncbi:MAG: PEGA domain-containing protein [Candidatus Hydrogenedens sp.]|nr:PEGA domain-containing protein [Candidatus Hydrogenedens sp.]